jgi:hypothetical protein
MSGTSYFAPFCVQKDVSAMRKETIQYFEPYQLLSISKICDKLVILQNVRFSGGGLHARIICYIISYRIDRSYSCRTITIWKKRWTIWSNFRWSRTIIW